MAGKVKAAAKDTRSVDIEDTYVLEFWAKEFNVSADKLIPAVTTVGTDTQW